MMEPEGRGRLSDSKNLTDKHYELKPDWGPRGRHHWALHTKASMLRAVASLLGKPTRCWASWGLGWPLQLASFSPQQASLQCVSPWKAVLDSCPQTEKWKGNSRKEGKKERRRKERSDPCNHRAHLSTMPVFRMDLEGCNNQWHSGKWKIGKTQHRLPPGRPGKTNWVYFFD